MSFVSAHYQLSSRFVDNNRRRLLGGAASGFALAILSPFARSTSIDYPFTLGVASGDPLPDGFVIWTRLAPLFNAEDGSGGLSDPVKVRWKIASDENMVNVIKQGQIIAQAQLAHSVHVDITGLEASRPYWYQFEALGAQSPIGRSLTAPPIYEASPIKTGFVSCSHWELGYFSAYRHLTSEKPDLVFFLGDYIYENSNPQNSSKIVRSHGSGVSQDLAGYRNRYALYKTDPDLQALHACCPSVVTWDDHEVQNDYAGQWSKDPKVSIKNFLRRRSAAYQAFYEHMPLRLSSLPGRNEMRIYRRINYGSLACFHVLDDRQYRDRLGCIADGKNRGGRIAPESCPDLQDPARSMLGQEQENWLNEGFKNSKSRWNIISQGLMVAPLLQPDAKSGILGHWTDAWDGYMANRDRILASLQKYRVNNPVFWSGDIHSFWANDLHAQKENPESLIVATELVGSSITANGPSYRRVTEQVLPHNPHVRFFDSRPRGYVSVDIKLSQMTARFQAISDCRDNSAKVSTLKTLAILDGSPGIIEV